MAQDYAKKKKASARKRGGGSGTPNWIWLFTGVVVGAFVMFLAYLSGLSPQKLQLSATSAKPHTDNSPAVPAQEKPTFEFYDSLKNNEIIPPGEKPTAPASTATETSPKEQAAATTAPQAAATVHKTIYYLQVASLPKAADADAMKAKLILEGLDTNVQPFNKNGDTWYRVIVGPYTDLNKVAHAKETLAKHKLSPLVLQKKPAT